MQQNRFIDYITVNDRISHLPQMASWLSDIGAKDLATIIQEFSLKRESIVSNPWLDTACYVGFFPPALPKTHDVWLDLADFSVFVFIPTTLLLILLEHVLTGGKRQVVGTAYIPC